MSFTIKLTEKQISQIIDEYNNLSLPLTNNYTLFRAKINTSFVSIFKTGNLLIQGGDEKSTYQSICKLLGIDYKIIDAPYVNITSIGALKSAIGTDEVGTGDFFGSIVVAGCYVPKNKINELIRMGIKDSKELNDNKILKLAPMIMENYIYSYYLLDNIHYNYLTSKMNLNMNQIKAIMHNSVINSLKKKTQEYELIVIDAFTTSDLYFKYIKNEKNIAKDVLLEEKAENKYISVACASIIARYIFLKALKDLSNKVGYDLPKGAGNQVDSLIYKLLQEKGINAFKTFSKMNFKNLQKIIENKNN